MLHGHEHRPSPLTADRESLQDTQHDQEDWGPYPDGLEGRDEADGGRGDSHNRQRYYEVRPAPDLVPEVAEDYPAHRTGDKADRERGERRQRADERIDVGEVQLVEDQGGRRPVEKVVVPFHCGAYEAGQTYPPDGTRPRLGSLAMPIHTVPPVVPSRFRDFCPFPYVADVTHLQRARQRRPEGAAHLCLGPLPGGIVDGCDLGDRGSKDQTSGNSSRISWLRDRILVGLPGLEPGTSSLSGRAYGCRPVPRRPRNSLI